MLGDSHKYEVLMMGRGNELLGWSYGIAFWSFKSSMYSFSPEAEGGFSNYIACQTRQTDIVSFRY